MSFQKINIKILILIIVLFLSSSCIAQSISNFSIINTNNIIKGYSREKVRVELNKNVLINTPKPRISGGVGVAYMQQEGLNKDKSTLFFNVNILINSGFKIIDNLFLNLGTDIFPVKDKSYSYCSIYFLPSLGFDFFNNKLSTFTGAGIFYFIPFYIGTQFSIRGEYNFSNKLSSGIEFRHLRPIDDEYKNLIYILNINFSIKL